jgi:hypothetical protein
MPTSRHFVRRAHHTHLTHAAEMDLWLGPDPRSGQEPAFGSDEQRRVLWTYHRDRLMGLFGRRGRRPQAWWQYDSPIPYPGYNREQSALCEAGLLSEPEMAELLTFWRAEFDRAHRPDFFVCLGPGEFLHGARARREHCRWADIPAPLVKQWTAERVAAA